MTLQKISIENIKGISSRTFELNILPNKPSLLVAPNGFGKSSFAIAFGSLQKSKLSVHEDNFHINNNELDPKISIDYLDQMGVRHSLNATSTMNTISDHFSYFVINNQIKAKGKGRNFGGRTAVSADITIEPITLIDTIPDREDFSYLYRAQQALFGVNGKILPNIKDHFNNFPFIISLSEHYNNLERISKTRNQEKINQIITEINEQSGTADQLVDWLKNNKLNELIAIEPLYNISKHIMDFNLGINELSLAFLTAIQIHTEYKKDKLKFKKAIKYSIYKLEKEKYTETLRAFNNSWCRISPKEKGKKLIVEFPKANNLSNGQRDVITFITQLYKAQKKLTSTNCILIIDEVFDYLDDANLVAVQYYITKLIKEFKDNRRRLYPLILTHLNPYYFKNFAFKDQKIYFLDKKEIQPNDAMIKLLRKREEITIKDDVSKYLLHFNPNKINKRSQFNTLGLRESWGENNNFQIFIDGEIRNYIEKNSSFDPLAVCCAVRVAIEKYIYQKITNQEFKLNFLNTFKTRDKLIYAENIGVTFPEYFYLLGIIYNDGMHWREGQDNISPIAAKLENQIIHYLISKIMEL